MEGEQKDSTVRATTKPRHRVASVLYQDATQRGANGTSEEEIVQMLRETLSDDGTQQSQEETPNGEPAQPWIHTSDKYPRLKSAARTLAHRLGGNAYFVGSALHSLTRPRDVDVRIVLPNEEFTRRYGITPENWQWENSIVDWSAPHWKWYWEQEQYRIMLSEACGERTTDLSILPERLWQRVYCRAGKEVLCKAWGAWAPDPAVLARYKQHQVDDSLSEAEGYLTWRDAFLWDRQLLPDPKG